MSKDDSIKELTKVEIESIEKSGETEEVPTESDSIPKSPKSPKSPKKMKKHPLQHSWTLWYDYPGRKNTASTYANFLQKVEDFWSVYNYIMAPSKLPNGSNYRLFKDGVEPKWEDPSNKNGGSWTATLSKKMHDQLDDMWLNLILACIGDTLGDGTIVCGVLVSIRKKEDRLSIWTQSANNKEEIMNIGYDFKSSCELDGVKLEFKTHADMMKVLETNGRPKAKYLI